MLYRIIPAGDLDIANGDFVVLTGIAYARQQMAARFKFFLGEWFLNKREGVPYFQYVFVKNPKINVIRSIFRQVALSTPGIIALPRFTLTYNSKARTLAFDFEATFAEGSVIVQATDPDFIINVQAGP